MFELLTVIMIAVVFSFLVDTHFLIEERDENGKKLREIQEKLKNFK